MNIDLLHAIREVELNIATTLLPNNGRLLEIGAGTGRQAQLLAERGFAVTAIDIVESNYAGSRVWPIVEYDGRHIPAEDGYFDIIFSSNTLEHISAIDVFLQDTKRVLKTGGICVHILPSFTWRLSSAVGHYLRFDRLRDELGAIIQSQKIRSGYTVQADYRQLSSAPPKGILQWICKRALPPRHGERGNIFTEHYYFTEQSWRKVFTRAGFEVLNVIPNRLYYSGHFFLGGKLSMKRRKFLSQLLGSSCKLYVLRRAIGQQGA